MSTITFNQGALLNQTTIHKYGLHLIYLQMCQRTPIPQQFQEILKEAETPGLTNCSEGQERLGHVMMSEALHW